MATSGFQFVEEEDSLLNLFPHRYDYIYAEHPQPGQKPAWKTESRHPLSDRLLLQGGQLLGVRFGKLTQYCLLDIDITSLYHPRHDPFALGKIIAALEPLGLVSCLTCTSSHSGGLHLYFPFAEAQQSWQLALAVSTLLENAGFKLSPGQLEVFPNVKLYSPEAEKFSLFNAHRLPLQPGFYLLNSEFQPVWTDRSTFIQFWQFATSRNDLTAKGLRQVLRQVQRKPYRVSQKAEKFLNDLNTEIEQGWTGSGQTNRLLGRIALRTYVFHHVLHGGEPLTEEALVEQIVATARSLPGYQEWCRHQHEIEQRATEWARCVEASRYFPYASRKTNSLPTNSSPSATNSTPETSAPLTWNQKQSLATREKITRAIGQLLETQSLPVGATARFQALVQFGIGGSSLYRHRDLWHPDHLTGVSQSDSPPDHVSQSGIPQSSSPVETPQTPQTSLEHDRLDCPSASNGHCSPSLFPSIGRNTPPDEDLNRSTSFQLQKPGRNLARSLSFHSMQQLRNNQKQQQDNWYQANPAQRMQQFIASGDPILVAEAQHWLNTLTSLPAPRN